MTTPDIYRQKKIRGRHLKSAIFHWLFFGATFITILALLILLVRIFHQGAGWLTKDLLTNFPSRFPNQAGIKSALFGSMWLIGITAPISFVFGVGAAIYLEEYAKRSWFAKLVTVNISNLAGVPSIIYGLLGLTIFVRMLGLGRSVLAGALTMSLLILPIIVVVSREAIRGVPDYLRHAGYALGASRWQVVKSIVIPSALPGILTGNVLALSRAIGESAPLIMIGALAFVAFVPESPLDPFTVLPVQIYNWTSRPQEDFHHLAAAGIIVLLGLLLLMNGGAVLLRNKFRKKL